MEVVLFEDARLILKPPKAQEGSTSLTSMGFTTSGMFPGYFLALSAFFFGGEGGGFWKVKGL